MMFLYTPPCGGPGCPLGIAVILLLLLVYWSWLELWSHMQWLILRGNIQVAFVIGGLRRQTSTLKPFNPILGETYQGIYSSGWRVFAEQISHHPPISSWQVLDPQGKVCLSIMHTLCSTTLHLEISEALMPCTVQRDEEAIH